MTPRLRSLPRLALVLTGCASGATNRTVLSPSLNWSLAVAHRGALRNQSSCGRILCFCGKSLGTDCGGSGQSGRKGALAKTQNTSAGHPGHLEL